LAKSGLTYASQLNMGAGAQVDYSLAWIGLSPMSYPAKGVPAGSDSELRAGTFRPDAANRLATPA